MLSWFIIILFLGYMIENIVLLLVESNFRKIKWWEGVSFFLFGVYIDSVRSLKLIWK